MEHEIILPQLKSCDSIYDHPAYVIFTGCGFHAMEKATGTLVHYPGIREPIMKFTALSEDRLLVEDNARRYHLVSLGEGTILKTAATPRGRLMASLRRFALSPDGTEAYDTWLPRGKTGLIRIDLTELRCETVPFQPTLNLIRDAQCLGPRNLRLLETGVETIDGEGRGVNRITSVAFGEEGTTVTVGKSWISPPGGGAFFLEGDTVLEYDFHRTNWQTGERTDLLADCDFAWPGNFRPLIHSYDPARDLLQLVDQTQNIFVDLTRRKVVARYFTKKPGFRGAVVDGGFWIGTDRGVAALKFPRIEEKP